MAAAAAARHTDTETDLRSDRPTMIAVCMLAMSVSMREAGAATTASSKSQAAKTITKAKAQTSVRGTIPAGRAPDQVNAQEEPLIARILAPSEGHLAGLHRGDDPLDLRSSVALVVDQDTNEVLVREE